MIWIGIWLMFGEFPEPLATWKVSKPPETALLKSDGMSLLFRDAEVYEYDEEGNLQENFTLEFIPKAVFNGPDNTVWIHDGRRLLGLLNANNNLQWQKDMPAPSVLPFSFEGLLVYAQGGNVLLLDPRDGSSKFSLYRGYDLAPLLVYENHILIAGADGEVFAWDPVAEIEQSVFFFEDEPVRYLSPSPTGEWALANESGKLMVLKENRAVRWQRNFRIKISTPPVWLRVRGKYQLMVPTHGRSLYAYGERGEQLAKTLLQGRPMALVPWSQELCLLVPQRENKLVWYHGEERRFHHVSLENYLVLVLNNGAYVLLVDNSGIIRLYRRRNPFF